MAAERSPFDDDGLHESALILGAESHPRFELACEVLRAMGYKLTTTKQRRHELVVFGPAAYVIYDWFGGPNFIAYSMAYPTVLGTVCAAIGYFNFKRGDLV